MLQLYDTLTRTTRPFEPLGEAATVYVCGVTPYDVTHAGHAFLFLNVDVLRRYLEYKGLPVVHVQNLTDVDDDMVKQSRKTGIPVFELALANDALLQADMRALNALPPTHYPRASEFVDKIIEICQALVDRGDAYVEDGDVFFDVSTFPEYGQMAHESVEALAKRPDIPLAGKGRAPLDFLLWQKTEEDEPSWDSPWGPGRPGWHIECSAMNLAIIGSRVDIHCGGSDLMFPHHDSEIAQSESYSGEKPFVNYWLHTGMLRYDGQKMSKSLGNLVLIRHLLTRYTPEAIRLYFAAMHYRASEEFSESELGRWAGIYRDRLLPALSLREGEVDFPTDAYVAEFEAAMDNDLDTPAALEVLCRMADQLLAAPSVEGRKKLEELCAIFGIETH
ncbi:MAG: cysteine--tRNA ligase [Dehalococcoidia bacterium]